MLTITRTTGQAVQIGPATVTVHRVSGDRVWLAIDADRAVPVVRDDAKRRESPGHPKSLAIRRAGIGLTPEGAKHSATSELIREALGHIRAARSNHNRVLADDSLNAAELILAELGREAGQ